MIEQQFIFKDKNGNELQTITDMGQIAAMFKDPELNKPMDGAVFGDVSLYSSYEGVH